MNTQGAVGFCSHAYLPVFQNKIIFITLLLLKYSKYFPLKTAAMRAVKVNQNQEVSQKFELSKTKRILKREKEQLNNIICY